jgi:hypothetical protein
MLPQLDAQLLSAAPDVLAVHATGKGFVLELLLEAAHLQVGDILVRPNQHRGGDQAGHLVAGIESLS